MSQKIKNIAVVVLSAVFLFGFLAWSLLKPTDEKSLSERRALAQFPEISKSTVASGEFMSGFESYALDQFPLREKFRTAKAVTALYILRQKDNNDIYVKNGYASKLEYPLDHASLDHACERFRFVYDKYLQDGTGDVYISVIPDKDFFLAGQNGYPSIDYAELIDEVRANTDLAEYIDITDLLELEDFYRTDTHWRQERITDVADRLAEAMGVSLSAEYTKVKADEPFYGVYFGQSALPLAPDELYYLDSPYLSECTVFDYETSSYIPMYDLGKTEGDDPYEMFLSGSKSLLTIENPNADNDKQLIIFRDSFGSSIAPILAQGFSKITLVDIRYISPAILDRFISFEDSDVLFLYSTSVLNNSITIK